MDDPWSRARLQAVVGPSWRLRDEAVAALSASWSGPLARVSDPADLGMMLLGLDTPSLFGEPTLTVVRASAPALRKHREALAAAIGPRAEGGSALLLALSEIDGREALGKTLAKAGALHRADPPDGKALAGWLGERLARHPQGVERARAVAEALIEHLGEDADALLMATDVLAVAAGDGRIAPELVDQLIGGVGERPIWDFTGAVLDGQAGKALGLMYAGGGLEPNQAIGALTNELRKLIACCESDDDGETARLAGMRGRSGALFYARRRARELGRPLLVRLLTGAYLCQRQLRQSGYHAEIAVEQLVLHAQRVIRPAGR